MHKANRDSWGFGFYQPYLNTATSATAAGYTSFVKDTTPVDNMIERYEREIAIGKRNEHPHLVHFRIRTSGRINQANAHPFYIKGGLLIHNGHISGGGNEDYSDTFYFTKVFRESLPAGMTDAQKEHLSRLIGKYNKLAMLHDDGTTTIINEEAGTTLSNGVWVSNTHWQYSLEK